MRFASHGSRHRLCSASAVVNQASGSQKVVCWSLKHVWLKLLLIVSFELNFWKAGAVVHVSVKSDEQSSSAMKSGVKYGAVCFNPFVHWFITCDISYTTLVSKILHYSIFEIALIGLIKVLKWQSFFHCPIFQALAVVCCASAFPLHLNGRGQLCWSGIFWLCLGTRSYYYALVMASSRCSDFSSYEVLKHCQRNNSTFLFLLSANMQLKPGKCA